MSVLKLRRALELTLDLKVKVRVKATEGCTPQNLVALEQSIDTCFLEL